MALEPSIFEAIEDAEAAADAEGMADIVAGRVVPHEEVAAWLNAWGTPHEEAARARLGRVWPES